MTQHVRMDMVRQAGAYGVVVQTFLNATMPDAASLVIHEEGIPFPANDLGAKSGPGGKGGTCLAANRDNAGFSPFADNPDLAIADHVLDRLMQVVEGLAQFPERGSYPKELVAMGIKDYRQTTFKPYRVIYRVLGSQVVIYLIVDGRRDMQSVLARRLLGA